MPRSFSTIVVAEYLDGAPRTATYNTTNTCREVWLYDLKCRLAVTLSTPVRTKAALLSKLHACAVVVQSVDLLTVHRDLFIFANELERMFGVQIRTVTDSSSNIFSSAPSQKMRVSGGNLVLLAAYWLVALNRILWCASAPYTGAERVVNVLDWSNARNSNVWLNTRDRSSAMGLWQKHETPTRTYPNGYKPVDWAMLTWSSGPVSMSRRPNWVELRNLWLENGVRLA